MLPVYLLINNYLISGSYQSQGRLVIPECRKEYSGRYVCTVYYTGGEQKVAYAMLNIDDGNGEHPFQSKHYKNNMHKS